MKCPACGGGLRVLDSRLAPGRMAIRRRRECMLCGERFRTTEVREEKPWRTQHDTTPLQRWEHDQEIKRARAQERHQAALHRAEQAAERRRSLWLEAIEDGRRAREGGNHGQ